MEDMAFIFPVILLAGAFIFFSILLWAVPASSLDRGEFLKCQSWDRFAHWNETAQGFPAPDSSSADHGN